MSMIGWMFGSVAAMTGSAAAAVYRITAKAQKPRIVPNEALPSVPYESVEWLSGGQRIRGWYMVHPCAAEAGSGRGPLIVIAHGWGSNRSRVLRYMRPLFDEGFSILMYDARSHGESGLFRTPTGMQFRDDLLAALDWARRQQAVDPQRIGVLGHSLGAFAAVLALETGAPIAALVTDSMPVNFVTMIAAELRRRKLPPFPLARLIPRIMCWRSSIPASIVKRADAANILAVNARGSQTPVLLIHSRKDGFISPDELNSILAATPDLLHLFVDSEGHSCSERDPAFWPAVKPFFRTQLKK